ncbi:efflux RND transporter periplasmic adaptor subunit [Sphingomonas sp. MMSM20]|uniref:efflux RND transporter periplasmic adaptor subunit n=1 Tax=Sphingomonas lycopersici TaxID=2951807 RepID=UPI002237EBAA|nr:efflux RND transporter periplasmic adaptor subunit [Sphingomonas lycopersici]MCW6528900.1 efflux RND transporter periplasmic adaptor subunit [Sphingomonas lycopersici]
MTKFTPISADDIRRATPLRVGGRPLWQKLSLAALPVVIIGAGVGYLNRETPAAAALPTPTVTVATPLAREVNEWDDYVGRFEPSRSVEVRPRVSGAVTAIHFTDGAIVQKGQLLFTIDPRPFTASLAEARAGVASAASDLALAEADLGRANRLLADDAVSKSDIDRLTARVRAAKAALAAAQARVHSRALDVEFTQVRAPITGRISDRKVDPGNIVSAADGGGTLLTSINALDPIYFTFDSSEALYLKGKRDRQANQGQPQQVEIKLQDEAAYKWKGHVDFIDNGLNAHSGTIRGRAVIANPDYFLAPGMFGNMRLTDGGTTRALLIPDAAVRTDQARKVVMVVGKDGVVVERQIEAGPLVAGLRTVRGGIAPTDRVIVQGLQFARAGAKVNVRPTVIRPDAAPATAVPEIDKPAASQATFAAQ